MFIRSGLFVISLAILLPASAKAGDIQDEPYALRLLSALNRSSNFAKTLGLQAALARRGGSSSNPAIRAARGEDACRATLSSVHVVAEEGAWFAAEYSGLDFGLGDLGSASVAYARTDTLSGDARTRGIDYSLRSNEFYARYAIPAGSDLDLGFELRFITADVEEETDEAPVPVRLETEVLGPEFTIGIRHSLTDEWAVGVTACVGIERTGTNAYNREPVPLPSPPGAALPAGTRLDYERDHLLLIDLRTGVGWTPAADWWTGIDIQYLHMELESLGSIDLGRAFAGVQFDASSDVAISLGVSGDTSGNLTGSAGVAVRISKTVALDLSYQFNAFPEVKQDYGRLHQLAMSWEIRF